MNTPEAQRGGAIPTSFGTNIINFVYGTVSLFLPLKSHLIIIPEPMAQSIFELQNPTYRSRDTTDNLEEDTYAKVSNIIGGASKSLYVGKAMGPAEARRRLAYLTCQDPDYSAPLKTSIEQYALGTRIGCSLEDSTNPPINSEVNCDQTVPEQDLPGLSVEDGERYTNALFEGCTGNSQWMQCHNDVIKRAREAGLDPLFTLAIWIHESGASNYICGKQYHDGLPIQDFGYNVEGTAENFNAQIAGFFTRPDAYAYCGKDMNNFIAKFWFGHCYNELSTDNQNDVAIYIGALNSIYATISPTSPPPLPTWPK